MVTAACLFMRQADQRIKKVVIVGGGSAGWITAGLLAARHPSTGPGSVEVMVIESPDVSTIGVGEGTWPTMRGTLQKIGIDEEAFIRRCQASLKQGTRFNGWVTGALDDVYYHPFSVPAGYPSAEVVPTWQARHDAISFAQAVTPQARVCDHGLSPKRADMPAYAHVLNYGYHLDAGQFAEMLKEHCTQQLGVCHLLDHVTGIRGSPDENIQGLVMAQSGLVEADLFIDCTGQAAMLIEGHYGIGLSLQDHVLFNNRAWASQVPYREPTGEIQSQTNATAQEAGWVWDIGLATRRGIGYVYSSEHVNDDEALETLWRYLHAQDNVELRDVQPRPLQFTPGYRQQFWHKNCVAVGMSAGFIEPLEASALVMIELAADLIAEDLPATHETMSLVARRFNDTFTYRWERIIDFLKLHYVLSRRNDSQYWVDHRDANSMSDRLRDLLTLWQHQIPSPRDFPQIHEIFSAASYQYVLYGMGFKTQARHRNDGDQQAELAERLIRETAKHTRQLVSDLPSNRAFQQVLLAAGAPKRASIA